MRGLRGTWQRMSLKRGLLIPLIVLMILSTQPLKVVASPLESARCLDVEEKEALAEFVIQCEIAKKNNESLKKAFKECQDTRCDVAWYKDDWVQILAGVLIFGAGFALGGKR